jgi:hypothetical protein
VVVNDESLSHLHAPYRAYALLSASERIQWIRQDRWIHYSRAEQVLNRLSDLLTYPPRDRMPCLLLFGPTGMGKTRIVQKFLREHRSSFDDVTGRTRLPIVAVQMPPAPSERDLAWVLFYHRTKASRPYGNALGSRRDSSKCACSLSMRSIPFWLARSANSGSF